MLVSIEIQKRLNTKIEILIFNVTKLQIVYHISNSVDLTLNNVDCFLDACLRLPNSMQSDIIMIM